MIPCYLDDLSPGVQFPASSQPRLCGAGVQVSVVPLCLCSEMILLGSLVFRLDLLACFLPTHANARLQCPVGLFSPPGPRATSSPCYLTWPVVRGGLGCLAAYWGRLAARRVRRCWLSCGAAAVSSAWAHQYAGPVCFVFWLLGQTNLLVVALSGRDV